jgi:glycosyltransferase involved in cell wall biosynthesis
MPQLYRMADVFVLCSLREMMPVALLEATASGLPCVTHQHPILEWMSGPGGVAINMAERGALAEALAQLVSNNEQQRQLGERAHQYCVAQFSHTPVVNQILEYYRFVVAHHHDVN